MQIVETGPIEVNEWNIGNGRGSYVLIIHRYMQMMKNKSNYVIRRACFLCTSSDDCCSC